MSRPVARSPFANLAGIDGLRGIAALLVVLTHTRQRLTPEAGPTWFPAFIDLSSQGLTLFFALSGFLLFLPFARAIRAGTSMPNIRRYFTNRFLRIFPAYLVVFAIAAFAFGLVYLRPAAMGTASVSGPQPVGRMTDPAMIIANLTLTQTLFPTTIRTGITPAWSLAAELCFYVLLPVAAALAMVVGSRRSWRANAVWLPPLLFIATGLIAKAVLHAQLAGQDDSTAWWLEWGGNWTAVFAKSILVQADLFGYGMVAAVVLTSSLNGGLARSSAIRWGVCAAIIGLASFLLLGRVGYGDTSFGIFFGAIVLLTALAAVAGVVRMLESFPLKWTGEISYSVYLWHTPVLLVFQQYWNPFPQNLLGFAAALGTVCAITLLLSTITYRFIEAPALRLKRPQVEKVVAEDELTVQASSRVATPPPHI